MKKIVPLFICAFVLLSGCKSKEDKILYGDVNDDGVVDLNDLTTLQEYLANPKTVKKREKGLKNADLNNDGIIDNIDLEILMSNLANEGMGLQPLE